MANERLRQAIRQAGLEPDGLAELVEVDVKSVGRWLAGSPPYPRHRARVAKALGVEEHELWPELATPSPEQIDSSAEVQGAWAYATDEGAPDWQQLLDQAVERVDLLGYSLLDVVSVDGVTDTLKAKADDGLRVRVLLSAPDSVWVAATAQRLGQTEDYIGRSELQLEIERARGYLDPLTRVGGFELRQFYADPGYTILRFDDQMLIRPHLHRTPPAESPLLHLRHVQDRGLFERFAAHIDTIARSDSEPLGSAPDLFPNPRTETDRYEPMTKARYEQELEASRQRSRERADAQNRPLEQVRGELRRAEHPADLTASD